MNALGGGGGVNSGRRGVCVCGVDKESKGYMNPNRS